MGTLGLPAPTGARLGWRRSGLLAALVTVACLVFASSAVALKQVPGSPFAAGLGPFSVAFSPGGRLLATASEPGAAPALSLFSVNQTTGALTPVHGSPFPNGGLSATSVAFSPGGGLLATANEADGTVSMFAVDQPSRALTPVSGSPFATASYPFAAGEFPDSVAFSPNGGLLATANQLGGSVSVFSVNQTSGTLTPVSGSPFAAGSEPASVAFSPTGELLATANEGDGTVSVFTVDQASGALIEVSGSPFAAGSEPASVAFSPSGGLLAIANDVTGGSVSVFSVDHASGVLTQVSGSPFATGLNPDSVAFSPDGALLATANSENFGDADDTVSVFSVNQASGGLTPVSGSPFVTGSNPEAVAFSPGGGLLATANHGGSSLSVFFTGPSGEAAGPMSKAPPKVTGSAKTDGTLRCSSGKWSVRPTRVVYRWVREGTPIAGAVSRVYRIRKVDEGLTLSCSVTAYKGTAVSAAVVSRGIRVAVPFVSGCPAASASLRTLLRLLGETRARALGAFAKSSSSGQGYEDFFCLTPAGLLVGYPPPALLGSLPAGASGRVVWISTSNAFYSVLGIRPGTSVSAAAGLVRLIGPFDVGSKVWYLAQDGSVVVVLIVRGGIVVQVGIGDWSVAGGRPAELAFLQGLDVIYRESVDVSGPLRALDAYWAAIGAHDFAGAFGYLAPGSGGPVGAFASDEQREHVESAQFQGHVTSVSGSRATIRVVSLITHDREFGCRVWSGSYRMTHRTGSWRIAQANIHPRSCGR